MFKFGSGRIPGNGIEEFLRSNEFKALNSAVRTIRSSLDFFTLQNRLYEKILGMACQLSLQREVCYTK